ncbi:VOC family protein [Actinoalloteichus hymeniacidonis]|uniref:Glyoxalase-like domain-containing protein n=1 Tax=Actinoalloteichus hymeniacidonis TaxID=340345 RepID=A0AAC9N066_9PSEU|nr:VOC family protein [Actinoalloteichus hymeniacidonis]AOS64772.1 hypothetical protein TL08_19905 [Actinoalloteichus hymeniacidonis]MBB5907152.1 hypothetical protein [Actinoalloteichus hymeniacidonis]
MTSRIANTAIDAHDAFAQACWWAEVLGMTGDPDEPGAPGDEECLIMSPDRSVRVLFIEVPERKSIKNRIHFDLRPTDRTQAEEIERVLALGAREVEDLRTPEGGGWMVLADPEGNEFCILLSEAEREAFLARCDS